MKLKLIDLFKRITWAKNGDLTDFSQTNYEAGWAHLGDDTPTVQDFNYVQQMNDKKDQWLFNQLKAVLEKANIEPTEENVNSLRDAILALSKGYSHPKSLTADTVNFVDEQGHTHEIAKATLQQQGIVQLTNDTGLETESLALTAKAGKKLAQQTAQLQLNVSQNYIPNNKKSSAVNSSSSDTVATSAAVKTAYDKAVDAKTTAERKVGLRGNESIQGTKSFESKIIGFRGIGLADSQTYANANHLLNMGANDGDGWIEYKKSNRAIGTIRIRANGELSYNNQKIYHAAAKPQFNTDIEGKPNTLAGYGIGNFKIEEFRGNLNTLKTDGIYAIRQASLTQNLPVSTSCHIQVIAGGNGTWCRQLAYVAYSTDMYERHQTSSQRDSWSAWKKLNTDGVPIGAVVSFPRAVTNPVGFLRADGSTFSQQTFPDLYRTLGNHNQLPDLTRSDVGMTAYFAVDNIPAGWIAFDEIATQVTEQRYPELYRHLIDKYGAMNRVPKVADRFLRNAGNSLSVGQTQEDELKRHTHKVFSSEPSHRSASIEGLKNDNNLLDAGLVTAIGDNEWRDNGWMTPDVNSNFATGGDETRPKSLILKLCIKAINNFDDVVFWIKSHGEVTNAGALDAGRLAQGLQDKAARNHTHTVSQITDFNQATSQIINAAITYQRIGNVEIRKYPDGTMIQTGRIVFTRGNTAVHTDLVLPIAYIDKEYRCFITERYESRASGKGQYNWVFMQPKTNTTATITNWYLGSADWMTIGRWKR
ncbi:tail fiber protein [Haemophilus influenzae]|uniref:tail fiber protein n=1 Tax=Haemophilus influenzae TaxID=727 RepID=UPI000CFF3FD5|nr:tail fiber protein [Haemophilus influenzae]PRI46988.1 phage tail fiber repeat protein [Haemophilus influenzae]PRM42908.1 phage tail fiber repeat protein [Haemophilus influenzae]